MNVSLMKRFIFARLSQSQYIWLSKLKNRIIPNLLYAASQGPFWLLIPWVQMFPDKVKISLKSRINVVRKLDYKRNDLFMSVESEFEYRVRLNSVKKEPETINWIETYFEADDVLYDVGANVGAYSLVAWKFLDKKVKIYALEPAFPNFSQLCRNLIVNGCGREIIPLQVALSDQTSLGLFNYRTLISGSAVHALGEPVDQQGEEFSPVAVQSLLRYKLDDLIDQFRFEIPNHIKIDVDGTEFEILRGMDKTLDNKLVKTLMLEINYGTGDGASIIAFLEDKGFKIKEKYIQNHLLVRCCT